MPDVPGLMWGSGKMMGKAYPPRQPAQNVCRFPRYHDEIHPYGISAGRAQAKEKRDGN